MNHYTITDQAHHYERVSKAYARKHYQQERIAMCPVKLRPGFPFFPHMEMNQEPYTPVWDGDDRGTFDAQVRSFEHYNCAYETGYYAAFYRIIDTLRSSL